MNVKATRDLKEGHKNESPKSDGEIYFYIRKHHLAGNEEEELQWWAELTKHKRKYLKQFLKHKNLTAALDSLRIFPGLWGEDGLKIGVLPKIIASRCYEVPLA